MAGNHHGHTPAAWTGVTIVVIGFCIAACATVAESPIGIGAGLVVAAIGGVVGVIMRQMGLGQPLPGKSGAGD